MFPVYIAVAVLDQDLWVRRPFMRAASSDTWGQVRQSPALCTHLALCRCAHVRTFWLVRVGVCGAGLDAQVLSSCNSRRRERSTYNSATPWPSRTVNGQRDEPTNLPWTPSKSQL